MTTGEWIFDGEGRANHWIPLLQSMTTSVNMSIERRWPNLGSYETLDEGPSWFSDNRRWHELEMRLSMFRELEPVRCSRETQAALCELWRAFVRAKEAGLMTWDSPMLEYHLAGLASMLKETDSGDLEVQNNVASCSSTPISKERGQDKHTA